MGSPKHSGLSFDDLLELVAPPSAAVGEWLCANVLGDRDSVEPLAVSEVLDLGYGISNDLDDDDSEALAEWFSCAQSRGLVRMVSAEPHVALEWCARAVSRAWTWWKPVIE